MSPESVTDVQVPAQYESIDYWLTLPTNGYGDPRVLKNEPRRLNAGEIALKLRIRVPKRRARVVQTIAVTLPDELAHVAHIDVSIPELVADDEAGS